ncbi:MAG: peptidase domain-containing ABC transporter [Bacteroidota bacterium]
MSTKDRFKKYQSFHIQQRDQTDCGVACLLSIVKLFGSNAKLEQLRELSGTNTSGTSLLGLYQAAQSIGIKAEGFEANLENLKTLGTPSILHINKDKELLHFINCYEYDAKNDEFIIGDPAEPYIKAVKSEELTKIWSSKILLQLKATKEIKQEKDENLWESLKWMYQFAKSDFNLLFTSLALGLIISVLGLSVAVFSQKLVDILLPEQNITRLVLGTTLLLFLLLIRILFSYIRTLFLLRKSKIFNIRILDYFYQKLLYLKKSFFDTRQTGDLVARMNDTDRIQETISTLFSSLAIDLIMIVVSITALFTYSTPIGLVSLSWIPIFTIIIFTFNKKIIQAQHQMMATYAYNESNYIDTMRGISTIKVMGKEPFFMNVTRQYYSISEEAVFNLGMVGLRLSTVSQIASSFFTVGIIIYSSLLVFSESLSIGGVMAVIQLTGMAMAAVGTVASAFIRLQEARVALNRMKEFIELEAEFKPELEEHKRALSNFESLKIENLDFRFTGQSLLLKDIVLEVEKGQMIAILGESGCGKSTLLQLIQQFYIPEKGKFIVNGSPLEAYKLLDWRKMLGVVPQQIKIFNTSLLENILLTPLDEVNGEELEAFLEKYHLNDYFLNFPAGYETILGETGVDISVGQQQMVALTRALYQKPQLLLLDEATSALDRITEEKVLEILNQVKQDTGIIFVTHRIQTAALADKIYLIENNTITDSGTHKELLNRDNFYTRSIESYVRL